MAGLESPFIHVFHPVKRSIQSSILPSRLLSIGLGPLSIGRAPRTTVSHGAWWVGCSRVSLPEHGVTGLGGTREGPWALIQGSLVQGRRGQDHRAGIAPTQSLFWAALRGPAPIVPAVLLQTVRKQGARWATDRWARASRARWERGGARGTRHWCPSNWVVVLFYIIQALDWDCWGSWRQRKWRETQRGRVKRNRKWYVVVLIAAK